MWNRVVVMDGGMGYLHPAGNDAVADLHRKYLEAGADIIKTNTFTANRGLQDYELNLAGAQIARKVAGEFSPPRLVAGSVGPGGTSSDHYFHQVCGLIDGGADLLLAETMTSIGVAKTALHACDTAFEKFGRRLPVMLSITISYDGKLLSGETLEEFCTLVDAHHLISLGINCSFGARHVKPYIKQLSELTTARISCHPSAGLPDSSGNYPESPLEWADTMREFAERGWADIVGGCCGTTPAHIQALARAVHQIPHATIDPL
jgi:5-methyltetrahydrofolate--homocysteine methyltransferase